jgi:DNA primase
MATLVGRRVKLARSGRQMKGCCPFHGEKTPSFYVYEDGYHCFGCGAHGDAISFVMQTQGASFMEAVQSLAGEAGLEVPRPSPTAEAAERTRLDLHGVLAAAQKHYRDRLYAPSGAAALAYLRERGLTEETIARFGLGWSGEGRGALAAALAGSNATQGQLLEAGLLRSGEDGDIRGELFFNRVMFPIRDRSGRMISFGGRILGAGQPKYVNGPETPLFSKRRTLYALDQAREAARRPPAEGVDNRVVAVEGYMDVIALHQAGFSAAVAPLGTALTAEQLEELWRLSPSPTLCFDGDAAGARAAARAAQTVLAALAPDRTIRIATLPAGEDPDTLVRRRGPAAFAAVLDAARPLDEALFDLLRSAGGDKTPEQRTAFRMRLEAAAGAIGDKKLGAEYRRSLLDRFFAAARRGAARPQVTQSARPVPGVDGAMLSRARKLTAILLHHPDLARDLEEAFGALPLPDTLRPLRDAMLAWFADAHPGDEGMPVSVEVASRRLDSGALINHLHALGLSLELSGALDETPSCGRPGAQAAEAEAGWWHFYGLMHREGLEHAVESARMHFLARPDDPATLARFNALCLALFRLRRGEQSDLGEEVEGELFDE